MRDSLSRYEADNPYSWRSSISSKADDFSRKNTIPISSNQMVQGKRQRARDEEGEIIRRLTETLPKKSLLFIAKCGKYLFLALLFPPYFVLIRVPKWVAIHLIPRLFASIRQLQQKGRHHLQALLRYIRTVLQNTKKELASAVARTKNIFLPFFKSFLQFHRTIQDTWIRQKEQIQKMRTQVGESIKHTFSTFQKEIRRLVSWMQEMGKSFSGFLEILPKWKRVLFALSKRFVDRYHNDFRTIFQRGLRQIKKAQEALSWVNRYIRHVSIHRKKEMVGTWMKEGIQGVQKKTLFLQKRVKYLISKGKSLIASASKKITEPMGQAWQQMMAWAHSLTKTLSTISLTLPYQQPLREQMQKKRREFQDLLKKGKQRGQAVYQHYLEKCKRGVASLAHLIQGVVVDCKKKIGVVLIQMKRWGVFLLDVIRWAIQKLARATGFLYRSFLLMCRLVVHLITLSWHMAKQTLYTL